MKVIKNGTILYEGKLIRADVAFDEQKICAVGNDLTGEEIIDAAGAYVLPGLVDVHVHLREPGHAQKETIQTGTQAAAHGGFTTVFAMPNVLPFPSDAQTMQAYKAEMDKKAVVHAHPYATITVKEAGQQVVDMHALKPYTHWFSDDGVGIADDAVMEQAMRQAAQEDVLLAMHTEDMRYRKPGASVHDSETVTSKGWIGIPHECESVPLQRDLQLAKKTGCTYHACHISAKESVAALAAAKADGADVSAEVTAHHLLLEDKDVQGPNWKMNPPLRTHADRMALIEGLENGTLDFIANDHAPHTKADKAKPMAQAAFGIVSLETAFALLYTEFVVRKKRWTLAQLVNWMSTAPAARFGLEKTGAIRVGWKPDLIIVDLGHETIIDADAFASMGKNTPFDGWSVQAAVRQTIVGGRTVWKG